MQHKFSIYETTLIMVALESLADDPGCLPQSDVELLLNLRDDFAANS